MARVIAIANQKGGVGKTTTAINLGASLAVAERRTLIIDIDPQGNATSGLGVENADEIPTIYEVLVEGEPAENCIVEKVHFPHLDLIPSNRDLVGAEIELVDRPERERVLSKALPPLRARYDYVLVDCPPSLGLLTLNTLTASDSVLIPIQCEFYALEGLSLLLRTIERVRRTANPTLELQGVVLTMFDGRNNLATQVADDVRAFLGDRVYDTVIPRNVRVSEAPSHGKPVLLYDLRCPGAQAYIRLAAEMQRRERRPVAA
jgi:chromosome partitioning protein